MVTKDELRPIMPYPVCPHCGENQILDLMTYGHYKGPIRCPKCKGLYEVEFGGTWKQNPKTFQYFLTRVDGGGHLISSPRPLGDPELLKGITDSCVPNEISQDFEDAVNGLATSPPRLVAVACRYTIQRALLLKEIPDGEPQKMLNTARQKQPPLISEMVLRQCSAAIFMGGKGGHQQQHWTEQVGPNDAKQAVLATRRVILELFNPAALGG